MSERVGTLRMQPSGRWAICWSGQAPVEIAIGALFRIVVDDDTLHVRRMEYAPGRGYYVIDGPELCDGMRAAIVTDE